MFKDKVGRWGQNPGVQEVGRGGRREKGERGREEGGAKREREGGERGRGREKEGRGEGRRRERAGESVPDGLQKCVSLRSVVKGLVLRWGCSSFEQNLPTVGKALETISGIARTRATNLVA